MILLALASLAVGSTAPESSAAPLAVPRELKVVSYYPAAAGWTNMWTDWQSEVIARDLRRVAGLRANTVRVIVQPDLFGYPHPSALYAARLQEFFALAGQAGLHVQLTLFDWWYGWPDVPGSQTWARELLEPYVGDPRLAFVELRNELVVKRHTVAWARRMIPFLRSLLHGRTPVTISVAGNQIRYLRELRRGLGSATPDFFTLHYFGGGGETAVDLFRRASAVTAPLPLWVGETGYPTTPAHSGYGGLPRTTAAQEAAQAHFLAAVGWAARASALPPVGVWTLSDFFPTAIPETGMTPSEGELHYGLFRTDESEKPAARIVRDLFSGRIPLACNNGFEDAVADEDDGLVPAQWSMTGRDVAFAQDRAVARTGVASARLTPRTGAATGSLSITPPNGAVGGGESVEVRAWARGESAVLVVEWFDRRGRRLDRSASQPLAGTEAGWTTLDVTADAPARSAYLRIELVARKATAPVWFDDVFFRKTQRQ